MIRYLFLGAFLFLCLLQPATAAEQDPARNPETLNGLWAADIERTKKLLGEERAADQAEDPDVCLEFDIKAKCYRVWKDASKKEQLGDFPFELLGMEGNVVKLRFKGGSPTEILILDKDTLNLQGFAIIRRVKAAGK